jgi:hypothetical protein
MNQFVMKSTVFETDGRFVRVRLSLARAEERFLTSPARFTSLKEMLKFRRRECLWRLILEIVGDAKTITWVR